MSIVLNKSDFFFKNQLSKYEGKVREVYTLKKIPRRFYQILRNVQFLIFYYLQEQRLNSEL